MSAAPRSRRFWVVVALALVGSALVVALLVTLLLPSLLRAANTEVSDGLTPFEVGAVAQIVPDAGWAVRPDDSESITLVSPDRRLEVTFTAVTTHEADRAFLDLASAAELSTAAVRVETLASGAHLQHTSEGRHLVATWNDAEATVLIEATVIEPAKFKAYQATLAELLLQLSSR
jgi:hypothetical protein